MSSHPFPKVETSHKLLTTTNGYSNESEISSGERDAEKITDVNPGQNGSPIPSNRSSGADAIILEDETLSVEINYAQSETASKDSSTRTAPNPDLQKVPSSPKTGSLYHQRKEAIRGFVLSKLAKKSHTVSDPSTGNPSDVERRTIFSGIKEKLAKKLEDSAAKDASLHPPVVAVPERSILPSEFNSDLKSKSECELKSVVANELGNDTVDEAEECFEEVKRTLKDDTCSIDDDNISSSDRLTPPPVSGTPRSRTISNITETSQKMVQLTESNNDKSLSFSFSDLQKADDLNVDFELTAPSSNVPEIHLESCNDSDPLPAVSIDAVPRPFPPGSAPSKQTTFFEYISSHLHVILFKSAYTFVAFCAVLIYWLRECNSPFLAGVLCGLTIIFLLYLLISDFVYFPGQEPVVFPDYSTLPPLTIPTSPSSKVNIYEGWMNQLVGDYDQESFKVVNVTSVYVRLDGSKLILSYPKKQIPTRIMWNEVLPTTNNFVKERNYRLADAKINLLPENLPRTRVWAKRYPLCINLPNLPERQRSPSVDCSSLAEDKPLPSPTKNPSGQSLPTSLSGSPVHTGADQVILYLFARSDREKEEWYWRFYRTMQYAPLDSCRDAHAYFQEALNTALHSENSSSTSEKNIPLMKDDKLKVPLRKPHLDFKNYMAFLMKEFPVPDEKESEEEDNNDMKIPSLQWLNVFLGRLFYDVLTQKTWSDIMQAKIQNKLRRLKVPTYMQELVCTDVHLGTSLPQIRRASNPVLDERGLWLDLDIDYAGSFKMTLETKIKLQLLEKRYSNEDGESKESVTPPTPVISGEVIRLNDECAELSDDDDDDLPDSEASKEDSTSRQPLRTSTGTKLLLTVERWVTSSNIAENKFVKKCVGHITQTPIVLTVEVKVLCGTLALNFPPLPTDRLWYGFRKKPQLNITVSPKVGDRHFNYTAVQRFIEKKLHQELEKASVLPNMDDFVIPLMHSTVYDH